MSVEFVGILVIAAFMLGFSLTGIVPTAQRALQIATNAYDVIKDATIDELEKEKAVQRSAVQLVRSFISILLRSTVALLISTIPIIFADALNIVPRELVLAFLGRWDVIAIASLVITAAWLALRRFWRPR